jgi:hypothetical protein
VLEQTDRRPFYIHACRRAQRDDLVAKLDELEQLTRAALRRTVNRQDARAFFGVGRLLEIVAFYRELQAESIHVDQRLDRQRCVCELNRVMCDAVLARCPPGVRLTAGSGHGQATSSSTRCAWRARPASTPTRGRCAPCAASAGAGNAADSRARAGEFNWSAQRIL